MATLTTLVSFDGDDGAHPIYESLVADANGDLFGTTLSGGATGDGTVFELVKSGAGYTFQTVASLDYVNGSAVFSGLTTDSAGNLYGTAQSGGSAGYGTVFELAATGSGYSLQTLASFSGASGAYPLGGLVADAGGDLFGVTQAGGANSQGSVFELVKTGSGYTQQTLLAFDFSNGAAPTGPLIMDSHGDLFGTTLQGGPGNVGTVFELVNTGSGYTLQTLATFNGANGSYLYAGLTADAQGDLFGTTYSGGVNGVGTVFELVKTDAGYAFQTLASLDYGETGGYVTGGLVIDANGDLYGTAQAGGPGGFGTVFELVNTGSGYTLQTVHAFSGDDGASPKGTLILGADGNLYGATAGGGANNLGTVFEIDLGGASPGGGSGGPPPPPAPATPGAPSDASVIGGYVNAAHDTAGQTIAGTTEAGATVTLYDHGAQVASVTADGTGAWSYQVGVLADGSTHSYTVTAGNSGGTSAMSEALGFVVDTSAPSAPEGLADAAIVAGYVNKAHDSASQALTGTAEQGALVTVYDNGAKLGTAVADASTGAWTFQLGVLGDGQHALTAVATDAAGNTGASSAALTFQVDTQPPIPVVHAVSDAGKGLSTVSGSAEAGSVVTLFDGGKAVGAATAAADGTWSVTLKLTGGQVHQFTETAVDLAGNTGASAGAAYWANAGGRQLIGGGGDDVLFAQKGAAMTGGAGQDHFVLDSGMGKATVTDFASGSDQIWVSRALATSASGVMTHAHASGADTVITFSGGDSATLQGVAPSGLHAADFFFY